MSCHVALPLPFLTLTGSATLSDMFCKSRVINWKHQWANRPLAMKIKHWGMQIKFRHDIILRNMARGTETWCSSGTIFNSAASLPTAGSCYRFYFLLPNPLSPPSCRMESDSIFTTEQAEVVFTNVSPSPHPRPPTRLTSTTMSWVASSSDTLQKKGTFFRIFFLVSLSLPGNFLNHIHNVQTMSEPFKTCSCNQFFFQIQ